MHKAATTLLDLLGLLLVAAGAYYLTAPHMGRSALLVAGAVVLVGSQLAARAAEQPAAGDFGDRLRRAIERWRSRREGPA